jgi:RNase P/RNase MRP subunit POP5
MQRILVALVAASVLFCVASAAELSVEEYQRTIVEITLNLCGPVLTSAAEAVRE